MFARYVNEFVDGARVSGTFTLRSREVRATRVGDAYLAVELSDRTGVIPGVLFRPDATASTIPSDSVVRIQGTVTTFRGVRRVSISSMRPADTYDETELLASSPVPIDDLMTEFRELIGSVMHPGLRRLLKGVFGDRSTLERFCALPASQHHHHAHVGGLLAHSISVTRLCELMASRYDDVDRDLLIAAALLHDIGKLDELCTGHSVSFTDEGRLLGHVVSGVMTVRDAGLRAKLESASLLRLEHAVLSHHGELEWGAPKRPSTIEALILHHADNMDAKAAAFSGLLKGAMLVNEAWTDSTNLFRRPLFAPRAIDDEHVVRDEDFSVRKLSA